ncbi:glutathione S-transferase 1-like isoform X1 [Osmia bicornis bicornis]|uniref:glutathione S-transferase 1-like isoform X1 n=2 Tax=Osmia bicornis bicornis TaxID=1437191 RepID=UPI0010F60ABC|nr:glutathione S-transferase 1-like isoform X1 [Osmia bicornis bicornis]
MYLKNRGATTVLKRLIHGSMSNITLYSYDLSPPCRAVLMTAHAIGLKLNIHEINLMHKDHLSEEYAKINPQQSIPAMDDDGFFLTDSHAINCYLVDKYAKDHALYPTDLQKRALVNQFLYYDTGVLFATAKNAFKPIFMQAAKEVPEEKMKLLNEAYEQLNKLLEGKKWLAGDSYTLADINCISTASSATVVVNMDNYPNVKAWIERCEEELPGYKECNAPGNKVLQATLRACLAKK